MKKYEALITIMPDLSDEEREAVIKKYTQLIEKENGTVEGIDRWGVKKLSYEINFKREGYYVLINFTAPTEVPALITNLTNITESVMRCMISVKK